MPKFRVMWEIDSDADNAVLAAREAFAHMQREDSTACVFEVAEYGSGTSATVDLQQPHCPTCGSQCLKVAVDQWADVEFSATDHNVIEGPYGDVEWGSDSTVICKKCGRTGQMVEFCSG